MSDALDTPPATPQPPAASEPVIAERYRLIKQLGEGAMGAVYLAEHVHMRKRFALKLLLPEAMASPEIVARFEREAIAAGNIEHPGVCAATDFGRLPDGSFFLVLEYVDGKSLRHVIHYGGAMLPQRALGIARQILLALGAAHGKGVVHRDIKPENVMLAANDRGEDVVKVLDFGIAKIDANSLGEGGGTALTRMGAIYGTPSYMAPEQAMGKAIDHRVDLYAVGVMLHEMIAGAPPFEGEGVVILAKHVNEPPPPLDGVPPEVRAFVLRLLAKKPEDRPESAQQAVAELDQVRPALSTFGGTFAGAPALPMASAATVVGDASPAPPPVVTTADAAGKPYAFLTPFAKRLGIGARDLAVVLAVLGSLLLVAILFFALRPSKMAEDDTPRRAKTKHHAAEEPATPQKDKKKEEEPAPKATASASATAASAAPSPAASSSSGGGKVSNQGSGGLKGLGKKIKGLF